MAKFIEYAFRRWFWLVFSTILVAGLSIALSFQSPPQYLSEATLWTDRPAFLEYDMGWAPDLTPAQNQINRLNQIVNVDSFQEAMVAQLKKNNVNLPANWKAKDLAKSFKFSSTYQNLVLVRSTAVTPELARGQSQAMFDAFKEQYNTQFTNYIQQVLTVYDKQIQDLTDQYGKTDQALNEYIASHPGSLSGSGVPDFQLERLKSQNQTNIDQIAVMKGKKELVRVQSQVGLTAAQNTLLRVEVPASVPNSSEGSRIIELAIYGLIGAIVGLCLGMVALALVSNGDRSFFRAKELSAVLNVPTYEMSHAPAMAQIQNVKATPTQSVQMAQERSVER